jgi:hypothetical protein
MADTGSLASDAIRAYNRAYARDLLAAYPRITGFRIDWPEYPCYTFGEIFQDFSPHVEAFAAEREFDFAAIKSAIAGCVDFLLGWLTNDDLRALSADECRRLSTAALPRTLSSDDGFHGAGPETRCHLDSWLALKSNLSTKLIRDWREAITEFGGAEKELMAHAFMPPFSLLTGFDFPAAAEHCTSISPKLYTMHWPLMVKFWGEALLAANPGLDEQLVVRTLVNLLDLADPGAAGETLSDYRYPEPDEPHPIPDGPQRRKIAQVKQCLSGRTTLVPLVHGYGPVDDFHRRLKLVADSDVDGVWINRYGYLSDAKLDAIHSVVT